MKETVLSKVVALLLANGFFIANTRGERIDPKTLTGEETEIGILYTDPATADTLKILWWKWAIPADTFFLGLFAPCPDTTNEWRLTIQGAEYMPVAMNLLKKMIELGVSVDLCIRHGEPLLETLPMGYQEEYRY